jgi:hypothetical protein
LPGVVALLAAQSKNPPVVLRSHDQLIAVALLVPILLAILLQWRLVRWGWLAARRQTAPSTWPWFTTVFGLVLALNPLGLEILGAAIKQSRTDWFASLWLLVALTFGAALLLIGLIEWRIRVLRTRRTDRRHGSDPAGADALEPASCVHGLNRAATTGKTTASFGEN